VNQRNTEDCSLSLWPLLLFYV